jgi:hypothetical protein
MTKAGESDSCFLFGTRGAVFLAQAKEDKLVGASAE